MKLDGGTKADSHGDLLEKFNNPKSEFLNYLLSTYAGRSSLNLQTVSSDLKLS